MNIGNIEITTEDAAVAHSIVNNPVFEKILTSLMFQSVEAEDMLTQKNINKPDADYVRLKESIKRSCYADLVDEFQHFAKGINEQGEY